MSQVFFVPLLAAAIPVAGQQPVSTRVIEGRFDAFTTDEMGNVYALRGDVLELYDRQGQSWLQNSVKTFGRITAIDAYYSLKPMVFSPEQGMVAVLDNTLSLQGSLLSLPRSGFPQVVLACMSVQNHFWLFDERDLQLIRVDNQLRPVANTGRLDQLLGFTPRPLGMTEHENWLYVNDPGTGILVFDLFGTYARTIPITGATCFMVRDKLLFFLKDGVMSAYDMRSFDISTVPLRDLPEGRILDARFERNCAYLRFADRIVIQEFGQRP